MNSLIFLIRFKLFQNFPAFFSGLFSREKSNLQPYLVIWNIVKKAYGIRNISLILHNKNILKRYWKIEKIHMHLEKSEKFIWNKHLNDWIFFNF